jgi:hypothetical protein
MRVRSVRLIAVALVVSGCARMAPPGREHLTDAVRVAACDGPATSLPDSLARLLPRRTGNMQPDDKWADLALAVPGGFAGTYYDADHRLVLRLTHPELAAEAKAALRLPLPYSLVDATVEAARWDFAQLVDWFNYLRPRLPAGVSAADKDEALNRIRYSVRSIDARDQVVRALSALGLPCDLVVVDPNGMTVKFSTQLLEQTL